EDADRDDQLRPQQRELPLAPERAEPLLLRARRPVAAARGRAARIAARHRCAVERAVEGVLVEVEPAAERAAGAAPPRPALGALDRARRLAEEVRALAAARRGDRERAERMPGLPARAAPPLVAAERVERAVRRAAAGRGHGSRVRLATS